MKYLKYFNDSIIETLQQSDKILKTNNLEKAHFLTFLENNLKEKGLSN